MVFHRLGRIPFGGASIRSDDAALNVRGEELRITGANQVQEKPAIDTKHKFPCALLPVPVTTFKFES